MEEEVDVLGSPSLIVLTVSGRKATLNLNKKIAFDDQEPSGSAWDPVWLKSSPYLIFWRNWFGWRAHP